MANRWLQQFFFSFIHQPVYIQGSVAIGAAGAVSGLTGSGVNSVTRLAAGTYLVDFEDNYNRFLASNFMFSGPTAGAAVTAGSFVVGTTYRITTLGNTNYALVGLPAALGTPAVGMTFVATGVGAGTGTATAIGSSGIVKVELADLGVQNSVKKGVGVLVRTLGPTAADDTALIAADPADGSIMWFDFVVRNSNVKGSGE
jgi:hypothetical protein